MSNHKNKNNLCQLSTHSFQIVFDCQEKQSFIDSIFLLLKEGNCHPSMISLKESNVVCIDFFATTVDFFAQGKKINEENLEAMYCSSIQMIRSLYLQQSYLHDLQLGFYGLNIQDILIIDSRIYLCIQSTFLHPLLFKTPMFESKMIKEKKNADIDESYFSFYSPLDKSKFNDFFLAPEFKKIQSIPARVHSSCFTFSLAAFAVYLLSGEYVDSESVSDLCTCTIKSPSSSTFKGNCYHTLKKCEGLKPIFQTKLYWMLHKALNLDPQKRLLLFL